MCVYVHVQVEQWLKMIINLQLKMTEEKHGEIRLPRAVYLCRKYEFSQNEADVVLLTVTMQAGFEQGDKYCSSDNKYDVVSLCSFLDLPLHEVLDFLDQD